MASDTLSLPKRILARVLIVVALYPILLGGVANLHSRYRARWNQMRQEHREALERDRARREPGFRVQGSGFRVQVDQQGTHGVPETGAPR